MNAVKQQTTTKQPTARLQKAQDLINQLEEELAFMAVLGRADRLALPRITALNRPMVEDALITSKKSKLTQGNDLELAVTYYQQLEQFHQTLAELQDKITSSKLTLGAKIYKRSKKITQLSDQHQKREKEELFFPLQANTTHKPLKINRLKNKNEAIPIANIEGLGVH